jgi:hypothetical protein
MLVTVQNQMIIDVDSVSTQQQLDALTVKSSSSSSSSTNYSNKSVNTEPIHCIY